MVRMGRPKAKLEISAAQRDRLEAIVRRTSSAQSHVMRARIVLESAKGLDNQEVAKDISLTALQRDLENGVFDLRTAFPQIEEMAEAVLPAIRVRIARGAAPQIAVDEFAPASSERNRS